MKTRDKIIKESLRLFNENSFELTTTNSIAKETDILEGSLWYHFNSKSDLLAVHADLFLDTFAKQRMHLEDDNPRGLILGLISIYQVLWDYRYIMRDTFEQISKDSPELHQKLLDINTEIDNWAKKTLIHARNLEFLIIQDDDLDSVVEITLIILRHWLDYSHKKYPSDSNLFLRKRGVNLIIKSLYPYLSDGSKEVMDTIYETY